MKKETKKLLTGMLLKMVLSILGSMLLLLLTGLIPKSMIEQSCRKSGVYFQEHELFPYIIDGQFNTKQDNYADCILVNIMYHIDAQNLPISLVKASYYNPERESVAVSLMESLQEEKVPNVDYFRYWHGEMALLRPLFLITGIQGARGILFGVLLLLTAISIFLMWRQGAKGMAVCYALGNLIVQMWMCAFSVEYITTFLVMNVVLIVILKRFPKRREEETFYREICGLFCAVGVWTCFFDFLTTETLTITVPLLLLLVLRYQAGELKNIGLEIRRLVVCLAGWGISYAVMFLTKWVLSALIMGTQAFFQAMQAAGDRINGTVYLGNTNLDPEATVWQRFWSGLFRNQGCLFPFQDTMQMGAAAGLFLGVLFLCFASVYLLRSRKFDGKMILLCLMVGAVPYLRFMVLGNHSYQHYFFTYRAQLVTVTMLLFVAWEFGWKNLLLRRR